MILVGQRRPELTTPKAWRTTVGRYVVSLDDRGNVLVRGAGTDSDLQDINLDPKPNQPLDLQKRQGLGSFFNFQVSWSCHHLDW